jgi:hypothetical protein
MQKQTALQTAQQKIQKLSNAYINATDRIDQLEDIVFNLHLDIETNKMSATTKKALVEVYNNLYAIVYPLHKEGLK